MDLRNLPEGLSSVDRCEARRAMIQNELRISTEALQVDPTKIGESEQKNCEQMFGHVALPVGCAGPLRFMTSDKQNTTVHLPLATTEGALVASINRGCKALTLSENTITNSVQKGISRSICLKIPADGVRSSLGYIDSQYAEWKTIGESTSNHLKILSYSLAFEGEYIFLTINADSDEAMGMNMVTIAAQAIGNHQQKQLKGSMLITVAANVDSDKKPSIRTRDLGRGYSTTAEAYISKEIVESTLKSSAEAMQEVAIAKLEHGSSIAQAIGANLQSANIVAALYLATGQDAAHVVEGSLASTHCEIRNGDVHLKTDLPAVLVGVRGGGTTLPAQRECLDMLLQAKTSLHPCAFIAETVAAAVLAGELSLLAAQASHHLASSHKKLAR